MKPESLLEAARRFVQQTCRTEQSRVSTLSTLQQLHATNPNLRLGAYTSRILTEFCLANNPAPATVKARRSRIMSFFAWATWQKLIEHNPASELKYTAKAGKGGGVRQHTWLSIAEYKKLLAAQPDTLAGNRARMVCMLGGMLGLRRTEIADLHWSDFDSGLETVTLIGKGGKLATVGVPQELGVELGAWCQPCGPQDAILPAIISNDPSKQTFDADEFVYDWTSPISSQTVAGDVTFAGKNAGIHLECHDLRRTFANMLEELGLGVEDICRLMRHDNIGTTSAYLEKNPRRTAALAKKFTINLGGN